MSEEKQGPVAAPSKVGDVDFEFVDALPKQKRLGPGNITPRQAFPWEHALSPVRKAPGQWAKILTYGDDEKAMRSARTKATGIGRHLFARVPHEVWKVRARDDDGTWAVYVQFGGERTETEVEKLRAERAERAERIQKARANRS